MRTAARWVLLVLAIACVWAVIGGIVLNPGGQAQAGIQASSLASSAWPVFGHDVQMTRKSQYVGAQTNHLKWSLATGGTVRQSAAIGPDGTVYIGSGSKVLFALNPADGSTKWSHTFPAQIWSSPAIASDGTLFFGCYDGNLYAINSANGSVKWSAPMDGLVAYEAPTIGSDGTVYCASEAATLCAFDPGTGSVKWRHDIGSTMQDSVSISETGTLYVGGGSLDALDPSTGSVEWSYDAHGVVGNSPSVGADGTLYFGTWNGTVYALDPATRTPKWTYSVGSMVLTSAALDSSGTIYVGTSSGSLYAINTSDGSSKWSHSMGTAWIESSPAIGADGTVYAANDAGEIEALNPADGSVKWSYAAGQEVFSSPIIGADGTMYVGSDNGTFYAFGVAESSPTTVTLNYLAGANGSIVGSSTQVVAYSASGSAVTAQGNAGYHFVRWSDGSTANPRTDNHVTANKTVTATFALDVSLAITKCPTPVKHARAYSMAGTVAPLFSHVQITRYRWLHHSWVSYGRYNAIGGADGSWTASVSALYAGSWKFTARANGLSATKYVTAN